MPEVGDVFIRAQADLDHVSDVFRNMYRLLKGEKLQVINVYDHQTTCIQLVVLTGPYSLETFHLYTEQLEDETYFQKVEK